MSSEISFPLHADPSNYDSKGDIQADIQIMTVIDSFPQPFDAQKTQQPSSSLIGKSQNFIVSNTMSLVYVVLMSCISFIGWKSMSLKLVGLFLHMSGLDLTTYG